MTTYPDLTDDAARSHVETGVANTPLNCLVIAHDDSPHLSQIHTGFSVLAKSNVLKLHYEFGDYRWGGHFFSRRDPPLCGVYVVINQQVLIFYDLRDGAGMDARALVIADLYFKRSYSQAGTPLAYQHKVIPLGLNFEVYPDEPGLHDIKRLRTHRALSRSFFRSLAQLASQWTGYPFLFVPELEKMRADPRPDAPPRALFMVRAWDPEQDSNLSPAVKADRRSINEMRAECVRLLRRTYGARFTGGFAHTEYAIRNFKDVLLENPEWAHKEKYLGLLQTHSVCIATAGLHGSVGWKLGEYVAFSKAIVSEKLQFEPPEGFAQGSHYLEFSTPDGCIQAVEALMSDSALRSRLMHNNHDYYRQYLKADRLVWRTLVMVKALCGLA